jgi:hypothetical protein
MKTAPARYRYMGIGFWPEHALSMRLVLRFLPFIPVEALMLPAVAASHIPV